MCRQKKSVKLGTFYLAPKTKIRQNRWFQRCFWVDFARFPDNIQLRDASEWQIIHFQVFPLITERFLSQIRSQKSEFVKTWERLSYPSLNLRNPVVIIISDNKVLKSAHSPPGASNLIFYGLRSCVGTRRGHLGAIRRSVGSNKLNPVISRQCTTHGKRNTQNYCILATILKSLGWLSPQRSWSEVLKSVVSSHTR